VIGDLSLKVQPGERIGIVGRSGAGKSTLVNLLLRFHDIEGGRITIDGQDVAAVTQESLRRAIAVVTQDTALLHRSIRDNVAYGRPEASEAEVVAALERAQAWDFVRDLVDAAGRRGLDAHAGERGVKLSGGQRQRIAIARALLKDAPILVLDCAASRKMMRSRQCPRSCGEVSVQRNPVDPSQRSWALRRHRLHHRPSPDSRAWVNAALRHPVSCHPIGGSLACCRRPAAPDPSSTTSAGSRPSGGLATG
jgi:ABC-type thiamine transport system ATPase subunit